MVFGGPGVGNGGNLEVSALDGTNGFKLSGVAAGDRSGFAVSTAGDVNGDGGHLQRPRPPVSATPKTT